jgi:hypothetical protein
LATGNSDKNSPFYDPNLIRRNGSLWILLGHFILVMIAISNYTRFVVTFQLAQAYIFPLPSGKKWPDLFVDFCMFGLLLLSTSLFLG